MSAYGTAITSYGGGDTGIPYFSVSNLGGTLLGGSWVNSFLFAAEVVYLVSYFSGPRVHSRWIDGAVALLFLSDIACTVCEWLLVYRLLITHYGNFFYMLDASAQLFFYPITTGISGLFVQSYLVYRVFILSKSIPLSAGLGALVGLDFASMIWFFYVVCTDQAVAARSKWHLPGTLWAASSVAANCSIAVTLLALLFSMRSRTNVERTRGVIASSMWMAFESGVAPSVVAIGAMVGSALSPHSNWCPAFTFLQGRVYMLTLLFNLAQKQRIRSGESTMGTSGGMGTSQLSASGKRSNRNNPNLGVDSFGHVAPTFGEVSISQVVFEQTEKEDDDESSSKNDSKV